MKGLAKIRDRGVSLLSFAVVYVLLFALLAAGLSPERYDLKVGEVAPATIAATKDVEDTCATEQLRDAARKAVQPSYVSDEEVQAEVLGNLQNCFNSLLQYKVEAAEGASEQAALMKNAAAAVEPAQLEDSALSAILACDTETFRSLYELTYAKVRETLTSKLPEGQEEEAALRIEREIQGEGYDDRLVSAAMSIVRATMKPNMLLDEETTQANRDKAAEDVIPVYYKQGQNITNKGELITQNQIEMLDSLGMLMDRSLDMTLYIGLALLLLLMVGSIWGYMLVFAPYLLTEYKTVILLGLILVLTSGISLLVRGLSSYLMPVSMGAMLTTMLIKPRLAIVVNLVLSVITGLMATIQSGQFASTMFSVMLIPIVSGTICVCVIRRKPQRYRILLTGLIMSVVNAVSALAVGLITSASTQNIWLWAAWAAGSGILSAVLCLGIQPALEWLFNLITPSKLMELSNPNQPLLRRLLLEAPGTYHHSIIVANLAEAAADTVGADGLLARVGAYYHDIGKLKRPLYFKENQLEDNPHDRADPRVSAAILTAHTRDGAELAQKARLPQEIVDIIRQHHGDSPVIYFYDRALKQGEAADVSDFRYEGPRPQSREAGIVMMADTIEAAVRSMPGATPEKMNQLIRKLVWAKVDDGQLNECAITVEDIEKICKAFLTVLTGVYHERVEYPDVVLTKQQEHVPALEAAESEAQAESSGSLESEEVQNAAGTVH